MAIAFIRGLAKQTGTGGTLTAALDCTSADFLVVSTLNNSGATGGISGVTYNGVAMTKINDINDPAGSNYFSWWVLHAPTTGSNNIVATRAAGTSMSYSATCYSGVNQADSIDASNNGTVSNAGAANGTISLTVSSNAWILMTVQSDGANDPDSAVNLTQRNADGFGSRTGIADSNGALSSGANSAGYHAPGSFSFFLNGISLKPPSIDVTMVAAVGAFTLTGQDSILRTGVSMVASVGSFILTGMSAVFSMAGWTFKNKDTTSYNNTGKHSTNWTNPHKDH